MSYLRSIMLVVRGSYQAGMALRMAKTDIENLTKAQKQTLKATEEMVRQSHQMLFAGAAFTVFGGLVTKGLMKVMEASREGRKALFNFSRSTTKSIQRISRALAPMMDWILKLTAGILEFISTSPFWSKVAAGVLFVAGPILLLSGAVVLLGGSTKYLMALWKRKSVLADMLGQKVNYLQASMDGYTGSVNRANVTTKTLIGSTITFGAALQMAFAGLLIGVTIFTAFKDVIGEVPAALFALAAALVPIIVKLWLAAGAMTVLTGGLAAVAAGAALGGVMAMLPQYQAGTSFVSQGGLAVLHGGEEIKSARESRFTSKIEKSTFQTGPSGPQTVGYYNIPITIDQLNTKADVEDLAVKFKRALKDALDNKV